MSSSRWVGQALDGLMRLVVACWIVACFWYFWIEDLAVATEDEPLLRISLDEERELFGHKAVAGMDDEREVDDTADEEAEERQREAEKLAMAKKRYRASSMIKRLSDDDNKRKIEEEDGRKKKSKEAGKGSLRDRISTRKYRDQAMPFSDLEEKRASELDNNWEEERSYTGDGQQKASSHNLGRKDQGDAPHNNNRLPAAPMQLFSEPAMPSPAIVVMAHARPNLLYTTLKSLAGLTGIRKYKVYISQDGKDTEVQETAELFSEFVHIQRERVETVRGQGKTAYIAQHYQHTLDTLFFTYKHSHVVIVEDDMTFAPDFCSYFEQLAFLLDTDPSLWCISSWNDNGFENLVSDTARLERTQYFPGLGWMLKREAWSFLREHWPLDHWDHWLRFSDILKGRECIYPEVSRNYNTGDKGTNLNEDHYSKYFLRIKLNNDPNVVFDDLSYLLQWNYDKAMQQLVDDAIVLNSLKDRAGKGSGQVFLLPYLREDFAEIAELFHVWTIPRAYHNHTQVVKFQGNTYILADKRRSPYLAPAQQEQPHQELVVLTAMMGEDCNACCASKNMRCFVHDFDFLNDCRILKSYFPCEKGCGMETGPDIPNYVSGEDRNKGKCLVTEEFSTCSARHKATSRLCPCMPRTAGSQ